MTSRQLAKEIFTAALDTKGEEAVVLDLKKLTSFTDYFVIVSGRSDRQVQAIADNIMEALNKKRIKAFGIEGYEAGHWILLDFGAVVAHIFYRETRIFYDLEKLWSDAPKVRFRQSKPKVQA